MGKAISYIIASAILWLAVCTIVPFWNRYMITSDLKATALFGTKNSITDARELLVKKLDERNVDFDPHDFHIEKQENNTVTVQITYFDEISFLGIILNAIEFTLEVTEEETEEHY
ncbi:MAG: hypothetical protein JRJ85_03835 [Deltaproteobacteria bacterium]|nr:hypothetical protein [Deltaproteobacteria bacterium]